MARKLLLCSAALAAVAFCGGPAPGFGFGIEAAQARDTYTRKRVNGRWITGTFAYKRSGRSAGEQQLTQVAAAVPVSDGSSPPVAERSSGVEEPAATGSLGDYAVWLQRSAAERKPIPLGEAPQAFFAPTREIKSVVIDYQSGIKTIFYVDGGVWEQPVLAEPIATGTIQTWPLGAAQ